MPDPITVGFLAAKALAMAGEAMTKGVVSEVVKDGYKSLKDKVSTWTSNDVENLERSPTQGRQTIVAEVIDDQADPDRKVIEQLANHFLSALSQVDSAAAIGFDIENLKARVVDLSSMTVINGTGVRSRLTEIDTLTAPATTVGMSPQKT